MMIIIIIMVVFFVNGILKVIFVYAVVCCVTSPLLPSQPPFLSFFLTYFLHLSPFFFYFNISPPYATFPFIFFLSVSQLALLMQMEMDLLLWIKSIPLFFSYFYFLHTSPAVFSLSSSSLPPSFLPPSFLKVCPFNTSSCQQIGLLY